MIERMQVTWLAADAAYSTVELAELSGLPRDMLDDLVGCGALPAATDRSDACFAGESVALACAARRLHEHFELDERGLAVAVSLLRRVRRLEAELTTVRARSSPVFD